MFFGEKTLKTAFSEAIVGLNVGINVAFQAQNKQRAVGLRHFFVGLK
jgi:hypothetical protein